MVGHFLLQSCAANVIHFCKGCRSVKAKLFGLKLFNCTICNHKQRLSYLECKNIAFYEETQTAKFDG